jgi:hypothetical protein
VLFAVLCDSYYSAQIYNSTVYTNRLVLLARYSLVYTMFFDRRFVFIVVDIFSSEYGVYVRYKPWVCLLCPYSMISSFEQYINSCYTYINNPSDII